jgi:hypothetical protein
MIPEALPYNECYTVREKFATDQEDSLFRSPTDVIHQC